MFVHAHSLSRLRRQLPPRGSLWDSLCFKVVNVINNGLPSQMEPFVFLSLEAVRTSTDCRTQTVERQIFLAAKPLYLSLHLRGRCQFCRVKIDGGSSRIKVLTHSPHPSTTGRGRAVPSVCVADISPLCGESPSRRWPLTVDRCLSRLPLLSASYSKGSLQEGAGNCRF